MIQLQFILGDAAVTTPTGLDEPAIIAAVAAPHHKRVSWADFATAMERTSFGHY